MNIHFIQHLNDVGYNSHKSASIQRERTVPYLTRETPDPEPIDCRILTAALDLFVDRGFHNVSVHDVQKQANVSIGSIYNHFGGKEGIAKALYDRLLNEIDILVQSVMHDESSAKARCSKIISLLFEYTESHRNIIAFIFHPKHAEFLPGELPTCTTDPFKSIHEIVEQGMEEGEIRQSNPCVAVAATFGGAYHMIQLRLDGMIKVPLPTLLDELLQNTWQGMDVPTKRSRKKKSVRLAGSS